MDRLITVILVILFLTTTSVFADSMQKPDFVVDWEQMKVTVYGSSRIIPQERGNVIDWQLQAARNAEIKDQTRKFALGTIFALPLFILSMGRDFNLIGLWSHAPWVNWFFLALATPVQFYTGWDFYKGGVKSLKNKSANMDVLVAMGSSVAYFYSLAVLIFPSLY